MCTSSACGKFVWTLNSLPSLALFPLFVCHLFAEKNNTGYSLCHCLVACSPQQHRHTHVSSSARYEATSGVWPIPSFAYLTELPAGATPSGGASPIPKFSLNSLVSVGYTNHPPIKPKLAPHGAWILVKQEETRRSKQRRLAISVQGRDARRKKRNESYT